MNIHTLVEKIKNWRKPTTVKAQKEEVIKREQWMKYLEELGVVPGICIEFGKTLNNVLDVYWDERYNLPAIKVFCREDKGESIIVFNAPMDEIGKRIKIIFC